MKILFYFRGFAPVGGIETFCKNLLCYLHAQNYDCRLVCWGQPSPLLQSIGQAGIKVVQTPLQQGCRWNLPDWLLLPFGLQQVKQADLVVFGKPFPNSILQRLRRQAGDRTKFVYITPYRPLPPETAAERQQCLEMLNCFDLILVQAAIFQDDLRQIGYQGPVEIIPYLPRQLGTLKPFPPVEPLNIGFLGRLVNDKNLPLLFKAFREFQDRYLASPAGATQKPPQLHLFGEGYLRQSLEQLAQQLAIESSVVFHGAIANDRIEEAIASCHLFAFSSQVEGQCLAALEILSCGRPIVGTTAGAFPEILADARLGRLIQPSTFDRLADGLVELADLITQQSMSPELIRAAYLERYASEKVGQRYTAVFDALVNSGCIPVL